MKVRYTVPSSTARVAYTGNGVTTEFPVPYKFFVAADLVVTLVSAAGVETTQNLNVNYLVSGGSGQVGTLTMIIPPVPGFTLVIVRAMPYTQEIDLEPNDPFPAEVTEEGFDRGVMLAQQNLLLVQRSPKLPLTYDPEASGEITIPAPENGKYLVGNSSGQGWMNINAPGSDISDDTYTPTWVGSAPRILRYRLMDRMSLTDFGVVPDPGNYVDITAAMNAALDVISNSSPSSDTQGPVLEIPHGLFRLDPITTPVRSLRMSGAGRFATTIRANNASAPHLFHFTNQSSNVDLSQFQVKGWLNTGAPAEYPTSGFIFEGGTNELHQLELNRCRNLVWLKRGARNRVWRTHFGFFNTYALKLGGVDNGTPLTGPVTSQTWSASVITYGRNSHGLAVGDVFSITGASPAGYNRTSAVITAVTSNTFSCAEATNPGTSTVLGNVTASVSNGAFLSETRIHESTFFSGASAQGFSHIGVQIGCLTDNGATKIENCDGGSALIGVEVFDDLNLGTQRATGFLTLEDYTSGVTRDCGLWIKDNGGSIEARTCNFSADGASDADGVRVDSILAAPSFTDCDFHRVSRDAIRVTEARTVTVIDSRAYQIGSSGSPGIGVHCVSGTGVVTVMGGVYDGDLQSPSPTRQMNFAVRKASGFTGQLHIIDVEARNQLIADFSDQSPSTGTFRLYRSPRSGTLVLTDDTAGTIPALRRPGGCMIAVSTEGNPAAVPSFILQVRSNVAVAPAFIVGAAGNLAATTVPLTGTTGTDGNMTVSSDGTATLYIENRLGGTRTLNWSIIAG